MVAAWLADATTNLNPIADALLQSLYRYISNPASLLHDPALHRSLTGLMSKLFAQLVAEMRKLGAIIVSANFNSIIICTGYTKYLLEALRRRELFSWLELAPVRWWHALLFRDPYNWGGLEAVVPASLLAEGAAEVEEEEEAGQEGEQPTFRFHWNLKEYLPQALQEPFVVLLTEFVYLPWREAKNAALRGASQGGSQAVADAAKAEELQAQHLQGYVLDHFTDRLLKLVADAQRCMVHGSERPEQQFPQLAGSHLTSEELGTPALAFVRTICHVLALDSRVTDAVAILRRQLLKLLHVREFGSQAEFKELCLGFTLPDVICSYCNDCRDMDLCRDDELARKNWQCRVCSQTYNMAAIERRLVAVLQQRIREYQVQDLQCMKCKQVASGHLKQLCGLCSGSMESTQPLAVFCKQLVVFSNIARFHGFELLGELAQCMLAATKQMRGAFGGKP
eukprot:gene17969-24374_t